jgi:hypothetical protein
MPQSCPFVKIRKIIFQHDPEPLEMQLNLFALAAILWVLVDCSNQTSSLMALMSYLPCNLWITLFAFNFGLRTLALTFRLMALRNISAMISAVLWAVVTYTLAAQDGHGFAKFCCPILALTEMWIYIRLGIGVSASLALGQYQEGSHGIKN